MFGWASEAAVTAQGKQQPPLRIRAGFQNLASLFAADKTETTGVRLGTGLQLEEWVRRNQLLFHRERKELLCEGASLPANKLCAVRC